MTQPSHDETTDQQLVLFDLGSQEPINMTSPAFLPQLPTPPPARGKGKKASGNTPATLATPTRLEISPRPPLPELPPLLLAGVRAALFQTLAQEAHAIYQALLAQQPAEQHDHVLLAVEPARLGASAQLLLDSPAHAGASSTACGLSRSTAATATTWSAASSRPSCKRLASRYSMSVSRRSRPRSTASSSAVSRACWPSGRAMRPASAPTSAIAIAPSRASGAAGTFRMVCSLTARAGSSLTRRATRCCSGSWASAARG